jgi:hypothetical protein
MRLYQFMLLAGLALTNAGCFVNQYSSDKNERMEQLLFDSENLRQIRGEWRRFWMNSEPSHMTYERVHGGLGP